MTPDEINRRVMAKFLAKRRLFEPDAIPFKSVGKAAAQKWLREIIDLARKVQRHLNAMPLEVRKTGALFPEPGGLGVPVHVWIESVFYNEWAVRSSLRLAGQP